MKSRRGIKFDATAKDAIVIRRIAERAVQELGVHKVAGHWHAEYAMSVSACHLNGCPLRLDDLLAADAFNFTHDVLGICRHIDRSTGQMMNQFRPRFAVRAVA